LTAKAKGKRQKAKGKRQKAKGKRQKIVSAKCGIGNITRTNSEPVGGVGAVLKP
jgi:hypothetical protein